MESNDSPEIPDRGETSDIPGLPSGEMERLQGQTPVGAPAFHPLSFVHSGGSCCLSLGPYVDERVAWATHPGNLL